MYVKLERDKPRTYMADDAPDRSRRRAKRKPLIISTKPIKHKIRPSTYDAKFYGTVWKD